MLYPKPWLKKIELKCLGTLDEIFYALQRLSDEELLSECRTYGGDLHKLEPSELGKLRLNSDNLSLDNTDFGSLARMSI